MTLPPFILAFVPGSVALFALIPQFQRGVSLETSVIFTLLGLFGVGGLLALVLGSLIIPFWQSIKAVIYYDLRSRREGMGLELRDR
jgi:Ca2+/Na+ antiporter